MDATRGRLMTLALGISVLLAVTFPPGGTSRAAEGQDLALRSDAVSASLGLPPTLVPIETGEILVTTYPQGATVRIDSKVLGTTPMDPLGIEPGWHLVQAEKPGLFGSARAFVRAGELNTVVLTLGSGRGTLTVRSTPAGALLTVDGQSAGETPVRLEEVSAGAHALRLHRDGYLDYETIVDIWGGEESDLHADLAVPARLVAESQPEGAAVYIGNRWVGNTPVEVGSLRAGLAQVTMNLEDFESWTENLELAEGRNDTVKAVLVPKKRALNLVSAPPGATIDLDGETIGTTPLRWALPFGHRRLLFRLPGYEEQFLRLDVSRSTGPDIRVRLTPLEGYLTLLHAPENATVTFLGSTPVTWRAPLEGMPVPAGTQDFQLRAPGYRSVKLRAVVHSERETILEPEWVPRSTRPEFWHLLVPGWSQYHQGKRIRTVLLPVAQAAAVIGLVLSTNAYNDAVDAYDAARERYQNQVVPEEIEKAWSEAQDEYDRVDEKQTTRRAFLAAAVAVYAYNLIDAILFAPEVPSHRAAGLTARADPMAESLTLGFAFEF